jgi:intracellular multiplication protein IcmD
MLFKNIVKFLLIIMVTGFGFCTMVFAADDLAGITDTVTTSFASIGKLMTAAAYLAGFGLTIASIFKFKQHKDNPQQIPMGTPIAMLLVGVALIFLPNVISPAGKSIFGNNATAGGFNGSAVNTIPGGGGQ